MTRNSVIITLSVLLVIGNVGLLFAADNTTQKAEPFQNTNSTAAPVTTKSPATTQAPATTTKVRTKLSINFQLSIKSLSFNSHHWDSV